MKDVILAITWLVGSITAIIIVFKEIDPLTGRKGIFGYYPPSKWEYIVCVICIITFITTKLLE